MRYDLRGRIPASLPITLHQVRQHKCSLTVDGGGHSVGITCVCSDLDRRQHRRLLPVADSQSVDRVLEVPRQAKIARLAVQLRPERLPQVPRHRATTSAGSQGVRHGTARSFLSRHSGNYAL